MIQPFMCSDLNPSIGSLLPYFCPELSCDLVFVSERQAEGSERVATALSAGQSSPEFLAMTSRAT